MTVVQAQSIYLLSGKVIEGPLSLNIENGAVTIITNYKADRIIPLSAIQVINLIVAPLRPPK